MMWRAKKTPVGAHEEHASEVAAVFKAVLESPGVTDRATREAAFRGGQLPAPLGEYAAKVRNESNRITDEDVNRLLAAGYSQDAIFEITVAAALGAASRSLQASLAAMQAGF